MRKRFFRTLVSALVIVSLLVVPAFAESATVTGNYVNVRSGPGSNYRVIDCLLMGSVVTVNDRSNPDWYNITYNGVTGFMYSAYLQITEDDDTGVIIDTTAPTVVSEARSGSINAMYVRFRSGPSTNSSVLGTYNRGKALTITGTSGDWTKVTIDGRDGYVYSSYVTAGDVTSATIEIGGNTTPEATPETVTTPEPVVTPAPTATPEPAAPEATLEITPADPPEATPEPTPEPTPAPTEVPAQSTSVGFICGDYVRFRSGPSTSYSILGSYDRGKQLTVVGSSGDWTAAIIDGRSGFVYSAYVSDTDPTGVVITITPSPAETTTPTGSTTTEVSTDARPGYIKGNTVRFRSGPSTSSQILGEYYYGNPLTITGTAGDWTKVTIDNRNGYVYSDYVAEGTFSVNNTGNTGSTGTDTYSKGVEVANYALQFVGYPYVWGGNSPAEGFDCSGLVKYVYAQFGYDLNRVAADQAKNGAHVDPTALQPGDILCFYSGGGYIGHVGIYIGDSKFVHAANSETGVIISELSGYYATRGLEARRIIQ